MYKPINLVRLLRGSHRCPHEKKASFFVAYEALLSHRDCMLVYRDDEIASLTSMDYRGRKAGML